MALMRDGPPAGCWQAIVLRSDGLETAWEHALNGVSAGQHVVQSTRLTRRSGGSVAF